MDRVIHRTRNVVTTLILGLMCTTSGFILITMEDGLDARLIGVVFLVGGAWTLIRAGFVGVTISDRGVVVRNLWRTYSLPWAEVQSIDPPGAYGLAHQGIQIRSRSGRVVYVAAFGRTPTDRAGYDQAVLSALRDAWHDSLKS